MTRPMPMGTDANRTRNATARRLARFARELPEGLRVVHRDLVPRPLVERIARSLGSFANLVDGHSAEAIGVVERGPDGWDAPNLDALRGFVATAFGREVVIVVEDAPTLPASKELALVELDRGGASMRLYLDPARLSAATPLEACVRAPSTPLVVSIEVASTTLARRELRALAPGDAITLDRVHLDAPLGRIAGIDEPLRFELAHGTLRVAGHDAEGDDTMDYDDDDLIALDDAQVTITVELARIASTVGELEALVPGAILATGLPEARSVVLRIAGRAVARGELITHEGELAVRIVETRNEAG